MAHTPDKPIAASTRAPRAAVVGLRLNFLLLLP